VDRSEGFDFSGDQVAAAWERYRERLFEGQRRLSEWIVDRVDPQPGQTILELAAGPGETGFLAAERIGPEGRLISTDLSEGMVDAARRGAEARGLTNVEFRVIDAQQIELPDASVDGVISRFGLMLVPEPARAFAEARRVLRPGRRLAYGVWGAPDRNPWLTLLALAVMQHGHVIPGDPFGPGGPFSLADADANRDLLTGAGFTDVDVEEIPGTFRYATLDDYWDVQCSIAGPLAVLVGSLSDDERAAIKGTLEPTLAPFLSGDSDGYDFPSLAVGVSAA
jgi:SAM-dependent methyltransferase